ncbi:TPA: hypothetical protein I6157_003361 [Vibrio cholerae]|nr:hypothetical protein [Vibrio cholerae]
MEKLHKRLSMYFENKNQRFLVDLTDVIFSPCYGFSVVKLETKHFYKNWLSTQSKENGQ